MRKVRAVIGPPEKNGIRIIEIEKLSKKDRLVLQNALKILLRHADALTAARKRAERRIRAALKRNAEKK